MKDLYENILEYDKIVKDILDNEEFLKLINIRHHGYNRYDHSLRVSKISFLIAKKIGFDSTSVARASLLHDFFLTDNLDATFRERIITLFEHPMYAYQNSIKYFEINNIEKNIILSHMFPIGKYLPTKKESLLVDAIDDLVSIFERIEYYRYRFRLKNILKIN